MTSLRLTNRTKTVLQKLRLGRRTLPVPFVANQLGLELAINHSVHTCKPRYNNIQKILWDQRQCASALIAVEGDLYSWNFPAVRQFVEVASWQFNTCSAGYRFRLSKIDGGHSLAAFANQVGVGWSGRLRSSEAVGSVSAVAHVCAQGLEHPKSTLKSTLKTTPKAPQESKSTQEAVVEHFSMFLNKVKNSPFRGVCCCFCCFPAWTLPRPTPTNKPNPPAPASP